MTSAPFKAFVVMPAFNEASGIRFYLNTLCDYLGTIASEKGESISWTILVVNDGSHDLTESIVADLADERRSEVVSIEQLSLLRNFGHQAALVAGLKQAASRRADFVITMDADGEHPMNLIRDMVDCWKDGASIVHTSRNPDPRLSHFKNASSKFYYRMLRVLGHLDIQDGMADYKLWDGELLRSVRSYLVSCGSTRAFASWLVPDAPVVRYDQNLVSGRASRFTLPKMISMAVGGLVRFSDFPIRLAFYVGLSAVLFGSGLFVFAVGAYFMGKVVPGWTSIVALIVLFGGVQCFLLGIYGEYFLRNIFRANLPMFLSTTSRRPRVQKTRRSLSQSSDSTTTDSPPSSPA